MPQVIEIRDASDPRLAEYTMLTDISLRTSLEAEHGLFIAEGAKVISRAIAAGYPVRSMLVARSRACDLATFAGEADAPAYVVPDEVAERLTGYRVHRGALAAMSRVPLPAVTDLLASAARVVVLEDLVDHGNVGAIFRCAAALGVDAVILSPRCADPLYRRSVKVSMGAVFAIPYARMTEWYDGLGELRSAGFTLLALTPDERATPIAEALRALGGGDGSGRDGRLIGRGRDWPDGLGGRDGQEEPDGPDGPDGRSGRGARAAMLLGTEGDGLSSRWLREADAAVRIPMSPGARAAGVDSLNVVAAAAIACSLLATAVTS